MVEAVVIHAIRTCAFLVMVGLGVAGPTTLDDVGSGLVVSSGAAGGFTFGGIAFVDSGSLWETGRKHEIGHLRHEAEIGVIPYIVVAGITSAVMHILGWAGLVTYEDYENTWTERMADEYGGVER